MIGKINDDDDDDDDDVAPFTSEPAHAPAHHRPSSAGAVSSIHATQAKCYTGAECFLRCNTLSKCNAKVLTRRTSVKSGC